MIRDIVRQVPVTFVTGKGGVGKSTVAAAMGIIAAKAGERVLVCELGTDGHLARVFDRPLKHAPISVAPGLDAANFSVQDGLVGTLSSFIPFERLVRTVVNNRILQMFLETAPSISEAVLLDAVGAQRSRYDRIIVELPASGHALMLLQVPDLLRRMVRRGPVAKKADELEAAILSPGVGQVVLVALPEALPVQETIELAEKMKAATKVPLAAIFLNQTMSPHVRGSERELLEQLTADPNVVPLKKHMQHMLDAARRDDRALSDLRDKLAVPVVVLPKILAPESPRDVLDGIMSI